FAGLATLSIRQMSYSTCRTTLPAGTRSPLVFCFSLALVLRPLDRNPDLVIAINDHFFDIDLLVSKRVQDRTLILVFHIRADDNAAYYVVGSAPSLATTRAL